MKAREGDAAAAGNDESSMRISRGMQRA